MGPDEGSVRERRRDVRVAPRGRVRLTGRDRTLHAEGRLVDVGAGGLRVADRYRCCPGVGTRVALEIVLEQEGAAAGLPRLVLDGRGAVVWSRHLEDGEAHAGIAFDGPVDVRRSFPEIPVL